MHAVRRDILRGVRLRVVLAETEGSQGPDDDNDPRRPASLHHRGESIPYDTVHVL